MTTLRNQVLVCPQCQNKMNIIEVMSFTVRNSETFSDGKVIANFPINLNSSIFICNLCYYAFWKEDALCDEVNYDDFSEELLKANTVKDLFPRFKNDNKINIAEYYSNLLNNGFANTVEKEIYIRLEIWRTLNDCIRYNEDSQIKSDDSLFINNLKKLIEIFEPMNDEQQLLVVEMYREIGEYKKAAYFLENLKSIKKTSAYIQIENAIKKEKSRVFKL